MTRANGRRKRYRILLTGGKAAAGLIQEGSTTYPLK
jgi:hypothetical protein